ncbi:winged helix-turn-helix transcriptional regulator [bacterium]|nr:winged helix-turn-helix transcriptional regulator [bacterium]
MSAEKGSTGRGDGRVTPRRIPADADFDIASELLKTLAHPVRLRIIELLSSGELCVKRLEKLLGVSQPSVSQHLRRLKYGGLIESERRGHLVCYRLMEGRAVEIAQLALERPETK